jgi:hypothetical protein
LNKPGRREEEEEGEEERDKAKGREESQALKKEGKRQHAAIRQGN